MDTLECELCNSQNVLSNDVFKKNICAYCFLNFKTSACEVSEPVDFFESFKDIFNKNTGYKNAILFSNNELVKNHIEDNTLNKLPEDSVNTKSVSKFLKNGKIDGIVVPDMSMISLKELLLMENLFSKDIELQVGIFTPSFINNNLNKFVEFKYLYSLFTVSQISVKNNFDIYDMQSDTNYMLLKLRRGECKDLVFNEKLQSIWENHLYSGIFKILE